MEKAIKNDNIKNFDFLGKFIRDSLKLSPLKVWFIVLVANIFVDFAGAWLSHAIISKGEPPGLLNDLPAMFVDFLMIPVICGYYIWTITGADSLLQDLKSSGVLTNNTALNIAKRDIAKKSGSIWMLLLTLIISSIVTSWLLVNSLGIQHTNPGWLLNSKVLPWLRVPFWFLGMYSLCFCLYNIAVTIVSLRKLFNDTTIELSPWHPDRCGGLQGINRYSLNLSYAIAIVGVVLSTLIIREVELGTITTYYLGWIGIIAYLVFAPLLFFLPLGTAHAAMKRARDKYLLLLANQFNDEYGFTKNQIETDPDKLKAKVDKIKHLKELYKTTEDFPIWPFDIVSLRRFMAITTAPLIPGILSLALDLIKKLLTK